MALIDEVRSSLHIVSTMMDAEIQMWIDAAVEDMRRCGVKDALLDVESMNPIAKSAVTCFVKSQYGYDNSEADRFMGSYQMLLTGLLNSRANEYLCPDECGQDDEAPAEDPDEGDGGGTDGGDG